MLVVEIQNEIQNLLRFKSGLCEVAERGLKRQEYQFGTYKNFGNLEKRKDLRNDLLKFLKEYLETRSPYLTFWAVFPEHDQNQSEEQFQENVLNEIGSLADGQHFVDLDESEDKYSFSLWGRLFHVVGLHPNSKEPARRFPYPALLINVVDQFQQLFKNGDQDHVASRCRFHFQHG